MKFSWIKLLYIFVFVSCKPVYEIKKTEQAEYILSDTSNSVIDSSVYAFILPYKQKMEGEMSAVVAESESALEKGTPESKLGILVADACMSESKKIFYPADGRQADFAFFNNGGLRRPLPKGRITRGDVFELMPFENELVVLTMNGVLVKKIFNFIASKDGAPVSGLRFEIKDHSAINITINDEPLDTLKMYKGLTSDYIANGGESFDFLINLPRESVNLKMRDAILQSLIGSTKAGKKVSVNTDGRISNAR